MKRIVIIFVAALGAAVALHAQSGYFSEIKSAFTHQTSLLLPSPILTPGPNDGSYLVCAYVSQTPADTVGVNLNWIDASGSPETAVLVSAPESGETGGCLPIRNKANTAPTVAASGFYSASYDIYVVGLGFWNVGPDKQGGITEPILRNYPNQASNLADTVLLVPTDYATYLVAMTLVPHSSLDTVKATLSWTDDYGSHAFSIDSCSNCPAGNAVIPIRAVPRSAISIQTSGTVHDKYDLYIRGVKFGSPARGTGPLGFYGRSFLDWVNPVAFNEGFVPAGMWVMAANGEYANADRRLTLNGFPVSVTSGPVPVVTGLAAAYQPDGGDEWFYTICGSYQCPEYSAEFNLMVF